jgi:signal transduction histidine kinase
MSEQVRVNAAAQAHKVQVMAQEWIDRETQLNEQKHRVIAYIFHEGVFHCLCFLSIHFMFIFNINFRDFFAFLQSVRNPINNASLAAELASDVISKLTSPKLPSRKTSAPSSTNCSPVSTGNAMYTSLIELVDNILKSTDAAMHVLNDALNLQKLQAGSFDFVHKPFGLCDAHTQVMRVMQPQMEQKSIEVS